MAKGYQENDEPIPGYRLIERIGRGGFGEVWRATGPGDVEVALKVIDSMDRTKGGKELRGLQLLKKIRHPNLVPLIGYWIKDDKGNVISGSDSGGELTPRPAATSRDTMVVASTDIPRASPSQLIVAMGLCERSVYARFEECLASGLPGIPRDELLHYLDGAAKAIDFLNKRPSGAVQHCDIKPQNILLVGGEPQVCDFGLARSLGNVAQTSRAAATLAYGAPELFFGKGPSESTDQYSLAVTYYEMLTGGLPFASEDRLYEDKRNGILDFSQVSLAEQAVLEHATAVEPSERFGSVADFMQALRQAAASGIAPSTRRRAKRRPSTTRRRRWPFVAALLLALSGLAAVIVADPQHPAYQSRKQIVTEWLRQLRTGTLPVDRPDGKPGGDQPADDQPADDQPIGDQPADVEPKRKSPSGQPPAVETPDQRLAKQFLDRLGRRQFVDAAKLLPSFSDERRAARREQLIAALHDWLPELVSESRQTMATGDEAGLRDLDRDLGELEKAIADHELIAPDARQRHWLPALRLLVRGRGELRVDVADQSLADALAARTTLPPSLHGGVLVLQLLAEPRGDENALKVLGWFQELLERRLEDNVAPHAQLDDWERGQLNSAEKDWLERLRAKIARRAAGDGPLLARARKIWPDLDLLLQLNEIEQLILADKLPEAAEKLTQLSTDGTSSDVVRTRRAQVEYRLQVARGEGQLATVIEQLPGMLSGCADPHWFFDRLFRRANADGAKAILDHVPPLVEAASQALAATSGEERSLLEASVRKGVDDSLWTCLTSPEVESGSLTKIATSADRFAGGVISPLNAVTKAEIQLDRMAKLSPSEFATLRQAVDEAAPKLSGEQAAYAEFIRTRLQSIGESAEDRKDAATRTGKLLRDMRLVGAKQTAWWTIRRDGQAAKMLLQGALQYLTDRRLPTDDDLPVIENKLPSPSQVLRLVDDSEKLTSLPADEQRSFDVLYISAMLRSDSARATEADLQSATTRADRLLSDMPKLQADKQEMLVRRMRGQLALREWDQCKSSAQRDAAIEHYAALIRHFYALSSPKPVQPDPDVEKYCFYHVSEPIVSRLLGSMCRSTPDEWNDLFDDPQVKVDAACLAAAYGRAGQRYPSLVVPALCVHNAFVLATVCDPSRPEYWLGKGRSLLDLPNMTVKELVAELAVVLRDERRAAPADAPPELAELQGLRGTLLIWNARLSNVESDKIRLLTDAMHALGDAQSRASKDEFYCTYLEGLSSVHLELAFLCPPAGCQEISEPPQDSKRWHLARAVTFAKQAAELPPQSRRLPENAHNAWGNALEDQAWYLRQTECFAESIRQFEAAEKAIGDSPRGVGTCLLHRGRCRLRYAIALPPGSIDDPARLDEPRVLPWNDVLEQLTLAEQDLTSAKNSFAKTELRERAEAHFWLGRVIDEQFRVLDLMSKIMVKPAMSREAANSLIAKAEAEFAAAAQLAKENADDSSWAAYQLELARFVRAAAPVRAATLAREILDAASPPASRKLSRQDVIDTCEFLVAGMPYNRGLKPEDFLAANEKVFAEHRKIVDRADQILSAKDAQSRHAYLDLRARTLVLFNGLASEEKRRGIRPEYEKLRTEAAKYWAEFPNPGRADAEFSWRKLDVALLRHELRQRADPTADEQIAIQLDSLLELRIKSLDPGNLAVLAQLDDPKASTERALIDLRRNSTCLYERFAAHVYETRDIRDEAARNARKVYDREVGRDAEKASRFAAIAYRAWKPLTSSKSIPESEFHLLVKSLGEARPPMKRQ